MKKIKTIRIDITPTWLGVYPMMENAIKFGTKEQKQTVCEELKRLCEYADQHNKKEAEK
jgi:hypothetical protein